jgi:hypothetical protein
MVIAARYLKKFSGGYKQSKKQAKKKLSPIWKYSSIQCLKWNAKIELKLWPCDVPSPFQFLVGFYIHTERRKGFVTSGILFVYWTVAVIINLVPLYINILKQVSMLHIYSLV